MMIIDQVDALQRHCTECNQLTGTICCDCALSGVPLIESAICHDLACQEKHELHACNKHPAVKSPSHSR